MKKNNKIHTIQARCTEEEQKKLDKVLTEKGITCSEYIRDRVFGKMEASSGSVCFLVLAQDIVEYINEHYGNEDRILTEKVDKLWRSL